MLMAVSSSPVRLDQADLQSIIERALEEARARGASQAEAAVSQGTGLSVSVRLGEVETLEHQRDRSMGITVYFGRRKGSASTADFSLDAVRATVAKACSIARFTAEDACSGLADAALMAREPSSLDLSHPWNIAADRAIEIAKSCEASALAFDPRINNSEGASLSTHQGLHVYGNTHGFVGGYPTTSHSLSCVVLAGTGEDMQRDYWYSSSRDWHELEQAAHDRPPGAAPPEHAPRAGAVRAGNRPRPDRAFYGRYSRQQPVPAIFVSLELGGPAGVSLRILHRRTAAHTEGRGQCAIR
jgi:PmbA protein